jgi:hypothetical protein
MYVISVEVQGDMWNNPDSVYQQLQRVPIGEHVQLDLQSEGPSLTALGVIDMINDWLVSRGQHPSTVEIFKWSNPVEWVPYRLQNCSNPSHFWRMSQEYWLDHFPDSTQSMNFDKFFGLFVGRISLSRAAILYQCFRDFGQHFLFSKMKSQTPYLWKLPHWSGKNLDCIDAWLEQESPQAMYDWYDQELINSLDDMFVHQQFVRDSNDQRVFNTNASILKQYHKFAVELVCETYVYGTCFFPTEKTIRPIMAGKPMIIVGPQYFLARLRQIGFQTFHNVWDESYDLLSGVDRWKAIKKLIAQLTSMSKDQQQQLLQTIRPTVEHNRKLLEKISKREIQFKH